MIIKCKYNFGDLVVLKTDREKKQRMIVGVHFSIFERLFVLACEGERTEHYEIEFSLCEETKNKAGFM